MTNLIMAECQERVFSSKVSSTQPCCGLHCQLPAYDSLDPCRVVMKNMVSEWV